MSSLTNHNSVSSRISSNDAHIDDDHTLSNATTTTKEKKGNKTEYSFKQKLDMLQTGSYPNDLDVETIRNWKKDESRIRAAVALDLGDCYRLTKFHLFMNLYLHTYDVT